GCGGSLFLLLTCDVCEIVHHRAAHERRAARAATAIRKATRIPRARRLHGARIAARDNALRDLCAASRARNRPGTGKSSASAAVHELALSFSNYCFVIYLSALRTL